MEIDEDFFAAFQQAIPLQTVRTKDTPPDMVADDVPSSKGWITWRLLRCQSALADMWRHAEELAGSAFPPSFKRWYSTYFTLRLDVAVVRLPANPSNSPGKGLFAHLPGGRVFDPRLFELRLLPFAGEAQLDAGPVCFDQRNGGDPDTWPICYCDHEWRQTPKEISDPIFSNFDNLLRGCTAYLNTIAQLRTESTDPRSIGATHATAIESLMAADPDGAGRAGRDYWQCCIGF